MKGGEKMKKTIFTLLMLAFLAMPVMALALDANNAPLVEDDPFGMNYGAETGLGTQDVRSGVMGIVRALLGFLGVVAVLIVLYGGFTWMIAGGNEEKVSSAKKIITAGIIGMIIIFVSYAIASFVITSLITATGAGI